MITDISQKCLNVTFVIVIYTKLKVIQTIEINLINLINKVITIHRKKKKLKHSKSYLNDNASGYEC